MAVSPHPKVSYEDLCTLPDDGLRRELIDGEVYVLPSPNTRHQRIAFRIAMEIQNHCREHGGGEAFIAPFDVLFSHYDVVQPDVIFIADADSSVLTDANIQGPPSLVIEVVSDIRRDLRVKRDLYASFGVPEYWAVDPVANRVEVYRLADRTYAKPQIVESGETLSPPGLPHCTIDVASLLA